MKMQKKSQLYVVASGMIYTKSWPRACSWNVVIAKEWNRDNQIVSCPAQNSASGGQNSSSGGGSMTPEKKQEGRPGRR